MLRLTVADHREFESVSVAGWRMPGPRTKGFWSKRRTQGWSYAPDIIELIEFPVEHDREVYIGSQCPLSEPLCAYIATGVF